MLNHLNLMCSIKSHQQANVVALCLNQKCKAEPISCIKCLNEIHYDHINDVKYLDDLQNTKTKKIPASQIKDAFKRFRDSITEYLRMIEVQFENYFYPLEQFLKKQTLNHDQYNKLGVILKQAPVELIGTHFEEQFEVATDAVESEIDNFFNSFKGFSECTWKGQFSKETEEMRDLGKLLYKQGKYTDSLNLIDNVLNQNENDLEMLELKACSLYQLAFYQECIVEFEKATNLNQKNADLYYWIGGACQELKQYEKAIQSYKKAKDLNPQRYQSLINYIKICEQRMQGQ